MLCSFLVILLDRWLVDLDALGLDDISDLEKVNTNQQTLDKTYSVLEASKIRGAESVRLRNDGNEIDT